MRKKRVKQRELRHKRLRKKISGTNEKPRLCVYRSLKNLSVQLIDDVNGKTILSLSTFNKSVKGETGYGGNTKSAEILGRLFAREAKNKGLRKIVFDKGGRCFHGRIKAFADSARKEGMAF